MKIKKEPIVAGIISCAAMCVFGEFHVEFDKITHWSGKGDNEAALAVQFLDDYEKKAYVWGFRWEDGENPTGEEMIRAIARDNNDFCALMQLTGVYGYTLDGIGYSKNNEILDHLHYDFEGASDDPYIMFDFFTPNYMMGQFEAPGEEALELCRESIAAAKTDHVIEHPLNYTQFGYPAYDYDWWKADTTSPDMRWNAGWYAGYWSYWLGTRDMDSDEYSYSGLGMSSVKLKNGDVNAWKFMPLDGPVNPDDFVDGTSGASVAWVDELDYDHFADQSSSEAIFIEDHADKDVTVFDIHGRLVGTYKKGESYNLPTGMYIKKAGKKSIKFYHK